MRYHLAVLTVISGLLVTGCGVVKVDNGCAQIKKQSLEKRDIGREFLNAAAEGKVGDGLTVAEVESLGTRYFIEGLRLITNNSQCFTEDEIKFAEQLLSP